MHRFRWVTITLVALVAGFVLFARYCQADLRQAIQIDEGRVVVTNLTGGTWSNVEIWLNDQYRAQAARLLPDQRLEVPLRVFVGGWGQTFPVQREKASGIEVTARGDKGEPIRLTWGTGRRR